MAHCSGPFLNSRVSAKNAAKSYYLCSSLFLSVLLAWVHGGCTGRSGNALIMATGKIGKRSVDALQANGEKQFLWDDELRGFGLQVTPAGAKSYIYQYRLGGREAPKKRYTIGRHGSPWTPTTARTEC